MLENHTGLPRVWWWRPKCGDSVKITLPVTRSISSRQALGLRKSLSEKFRSGHSELRVGSQAVELLRVLFQSAGGRLPEAGWNLVKRPAPGLWHFEVSEDEEYEQQHDEDDEHVGAAQFLRRDVRRKTIIPSSLRGSVIKWSDSEDGWTNSFVSEAESKTKTFLFHSTFW